MQEQSKLSLAKKPPKGHASQQMPINTSRLKVQLFISCRDLVNIDIVGKSDPLVALYTKSDQKQGKWQKYDQTEVMNNNLNPDFEKSFMIYYYFERHQPLKFKVLDDDGGNTYNMIGCCETTLGKILSAYNQTFVSDLMVYGSDKPRGQLIVRADSVKECNWDVDLKVGARNLPSYKVCLFCSKNAPFFEIYRGSKQDLLSFYKVYDSDVIQNTRNPSFKKFKLKGQQLCNSDKTLPIQFRFYNRVNNENMQLGNCTVTVQELMDKKELELKNPITNQETGSIIVEEIKVIEHPTLLDYLRGGWCLSLAIAIDFTGSNGDPSDPSSLHYLGGYNQYEQAIISIASILETYDDDKKFAVWGFGGIPKFMGENDPNIRSKYLCFPLNGDENNIEVNGAQGVLDIYRKNLSGIQLSGPTYFSQILNSMNGVVKKSAGKQIYHILLILTDGEIHDMTQTKDIIVNEASELPLSIIIIGVGNEKFKMMKQLDSDDQLLVGSDGKQAARDIVQFVRFKKYVSMGPEILAEKVLREVPDQFITYMQQKGIKPNVIPEGQSSKFYGRQLSSNLLSTV